MHQTQPYFWHLCKEGKGEPGSGTEYEFQMKIDKGQEIFYQHQSCLDLFWYVLYPVVTAHTSPNIPDTWNFTSKDLSLKFCSKDSSKLNKIENSLTVVFFKLRKLAQT